MSREQDSPAIGKPPPQRDQRPREADGDDAFERFEHLTRQLLQVPKEELDERRKRNGSV